MAVAGTILFGGKAIFGLYQNRINGPTARTRTLRHRLPGVPGYRSFKLIGDNIDTRVWTCEGRIVGTNLRSVMRTVISYQDFMKGNFFTFVTTGGDAFRNCELTDYRPASPYQRIRFSLDNQRDFFSVVVRGTIEQASP